MKPNIPTLDGWRAVAILMVIYSHLQSSSQWQRLGHMGVNVFFGLSGLLITLLLLQEQENTGRISLKGFYLRRVCRISPPMFAMLLVTGLAGSYVSSVEVFSSVLFFRNYLPESYTDPSIVATGHLWSLSIEEHFYLIWPGLLVLVGAARMRSLVGYGAFAIAFWRLVATIYLPNANHVIRTDFRLDSLLWGGAVAFMVHDRRSKGNLRTNLSPLVWLSMVAAIVTPHFVYNVPLLTPLLVISIFTIPMLIPFVIAGTVLHPQWALSRLLEIPAVKLVGRLSYSLYLWQEIFTLGKFHTSSAVVNASLIGLTAVLSYYALERPMIKMGRRISDRMKSANSPQYPTDHLPQAA